MQVAASITRSGKGYVPARVGVPDSPPSIRVMPGGSGLASKEREQGAVPPVAPKATGGYGRACVAGGKVTGVTVSAQASEHR